MPLDDAQLYQALIARDARFDGVFFVGVTSTRIYCRPVCRAPKPRPERCRYYATAAAAERRGFRPCLRCRPELAPGGAGGVEATGTAGTADASSVDAIARLARVAGARIAAGALDQAGLDALAAELGVSARHLRRAVERELGASPVELAQTRRLLAAKQLLTETPLPVAQVALASGFQSLRRFNALFQERYRTSPTRVRRSARRGAEIEAEPAPAADGDVVSLMLAYRPPLEWPSLLGYLAARATPGVEAVTTADGGRWWRAVRLHDHTGIVSVGPAATRDADATQRRHALRVELSASLLPALAPLLARLRRLLDLDAEPARVAEHLQRDPLLAPLVARRPGLRAPGALDGFELALRAVLGQQVSVRGATTLAGRLAARFGEALPVVLPVASSAGAPPVALDRLAPTAERLADATPAQVAAIGLPAARAACIVALAQAVAGGRLPELTAVAPHGDPASFVRRFAELPGIGPWTAEYVAMRALAWPDAFPAGDLALRRAAGGLTEARLRAASERWRPWRAYAAHHLWGSLGG